MDEQTHTIFVQSKECGLQLINVYRILQYSYNANKLITFIGVPHHIQQKVTCHNSKTLNEYCIESIKRNENNKIFVEYPKSKEYNPPLEGCQAIKNIHTGNDEKQSQLKCQLVPVDIREGILERYKDASGLLYSDFNRFFDNMIIQSSQEIDYNKIKEWYIQLFFTIYYPSQSIDDIKKDICTETDTLRQFLDNKKIERGEYEFLYNYFQNQIVKTLLQQNFILSFYQKIIEKEQNKEIKKEIQRICIKQIQENLKYAWAYLTEYTIFKKIFLLKNDSCNEIIVVIGDQHLKNIKFFLDEEKDKETKIRFHFLKQNISDELCTSLFETYTFNTHTSMEIDDTVVSTKKRRR
jgi:hypothetical protein